jgi:hypothetical protein
LIAGGPGNISEDELKGGVALIFRRKGKDLLTDKEFVFSASMDLRWFGYTDAQKFLEAAVSSGLVRREGKAITPTFEYRALELPPGFKPSMEALKGNAPPAPSLFDRIVAEISKHTGQDRNAVIARINRKRESMRVDAEVLALLVAREIGADIAPFVDETDKTVRARIASRVEQSTDKSEEE